MGISGDGNRKLAELAKRLAGADATLRKELRSGWRDALAPSVAAVQNAITSAPAKTNRGLRQEIARTVHGEVRLAGKVQVSVVSYGRQMPPGKTNLPGHADKGAWRHPVFGDEDKWVAQVSPRPGWFTVTNVRQQSRFAGVAQKVLDDVGSQVQG